MKDLPELSKYFESGEIQNLPFNNPVAKLNNYDEIKLQLKKAIKARMVIQIPN
jgi:hypothetical protein